MATFPQNDRRTAPDSLRIAVFAAEVEPLSKTGGLADVAGALSKYLHESGHEVRVFTPCYASIDRRAFAVQPVDGLTAIPLRVGAHDFVFSVLRAALPGGASAFLIDCPALYGRPTIYTADPDEHVRFLAFTRAALLACERSGWAPQVLHCNDWHTGFAPLYLRTVWETQPLFHGTRTLLTIHNIGYQGIFPAARVADLGLTGWQSWLDPGDFAAGRINALRHGILYADAISTVSPTYAREISTEEYGMGLQDSLRRRAAAGAVSGILNGVDYDEWDPRRDRHLPRHYDAGSLAVKAQLKREFLARHALDGRDDVPLIGLVSRLAAQKGIELISAALPAVLTARPLCFAALGSGETRYEEFFASLERSFPGRVLFRRGFDDGLAHWIEAASDMFLMPSRYEPCGLNQMYSLRYGTVPIVRRTGGLADSVEHYEPQSGRGTGVMFNDFNGEALEWALNYALDLYGQSTHWTQLVQNGMRCDFSWQRQGTRYLALYRRLLLSPPR